MSLKCIHIKKDQKSQQFVPHAYSAQIFKDIFAYLYSFLSIDIAKLQDLLLRCSLSGIDLAMKNITLFNRMCKLCPEFNGSRSNYLCFKHRNYQQCSIIPRLCPHCEFPFSQQTFRGHLLQCPERIIKCQYCGTNVLACLHLFHLEECQVNQKMQQQVEREKIVRTEQVDNQGLNFFKDVCIWCQTEIGMQDQHSHLEHCKANQQIKQGLWQLTPNEYELIYSLYKQSAQRHIQIHRFVLAKLARFGYSETDLVLMSDFIQQKAPLIIHFNLQRDIRSFISDTQYRTLFEVNKSGGNMSFQKRALWEEHLFGILSRSMKPHQRVKYGVLNYSNDKFGAAKCWDYGQSIIVLKPSVRRRCTIAHKRKYAHGQTVATLKYHYSVLQKYTQQQLSALHLASRGFVVESYQLQSFKEVHIHGPIHFYTDVEHIYSHKTLIKRNYSLVKAFQQKFRVKIIAIEDLESTQPKQ